MTKRKKAPSITTEDFKQFLDDNSLTFKQGNFGSYVYHDIHGASPVFKHDDLNEAFKTVTDWLAECDNE